MREVLPYVFEASRQGWDSFDWLYPDNSRVRFYEFVGDEIPHAYFIGQLDGVSLTEPLYLVEEISLIDLIVDFGEEPLEDPDEPTPSR